MTKSISKNNVTNRAASHSLKLLEQSRKQAEEAKREAIARLLREAFDQQAMMCDHLGEATYSAICIGRVISDLKQHLDHGLHQAFVLQYFCEPMKVDLRTVQRYCKLAKDMDDVKVLIETGALVFENFDERSYLKGQTFSDARHNIKQLLNNDSNQAVLETTDKQPK